VGVALAVLLVSYHYLVRPTFIGAILNGRKYPRGKDPSGDAGPSRDAPVPTGLGRGSRLAAYDTPATDRPASVATLTAVTKRYGATVALDRVTLDVRPGELLALLGPNGAGKSTAIGLWLGLLEPDDGRVSVMGGSPLDVQS